MKYRKKPIIVEAIQYTGNIEECKKFCPEITTKKYINAITPILCIETLEGDMQISFYDYIIKGISGEFYPCKPDIFERTYDKVEE